MTRPDLNRRHGFTDAPAVKASYPSPTFWLVTGRDFGRSNLWSKLRGNELARRIREKLAALK